VGVDALDDLYREVILDHYKSPRHHGQLVPHDVEQEGYNPLCGDRIILQLQFQEDRLKDIRFSGQGCSISQAAASILTEETIGKSISDIRKEVGFFKRMMKGEVSEDQQDLGDLEALCGVRNFPVRIKCALLPWTTLEEALDFYINKEK